MWFTSTRWNATKLSTVVHGSHTMNHSDFEWLVLWVCGSIFLKCGSHIHVSLRMKTTLVISWMSNQSEFVGNTLNWSDERGGFGSKSVCWVHVSMEPALRLWVFVFFNVLRSGLSRIVPVSSWVSWDFAASIRQSNVHVCQSISGQMLPVQASVDDAGFPSQSSWQGKPYVHGVEIWAW